MIFNLEERLLVLADAELISAAAYQDASRYAPTFNSAMTCLDIVQDELGHANTLYQILESLGFDKEQLIYKRQPSEFVAPYAFEVPLESWVELITAYALYDRATYLLLSDLYHQPTFRTWKEKLIKIDREENFHLGYGELWMRRLCRQSESGRREVQQAIKWMFPMMLEWLDPQSKRVQQLWLKAVVPACQTMGLKLPIRWSAGEYILDFPFPCHFEETEKRWLTERGVIEWPEVFERWRAGGPKSQIFIQRIRRGHQELTEVYL